MRKNILYLERYRNPSDHAGTVIWRADGVADITDHVMQQNIERLIEDIRSLVPIMPSLASILHDLEDTFRSVRDSTHDTITGLRYRAAISEINTVVQGQILDALAECSKMITQNSLEKSAKSS